MWMDCSRQKTENYSLRRLCALAPFGSALQGATVTGIGAGFSSVGLWPLFLFFLKVGSVVFGSGYVLLAFLQGDLVERWHWLTNAQLLDAVAKLAR
jgi:hypothetical protein